MDERRKYFRFDSPLDVKYMVDKGNLGGRARTKDVSKEGVSFSTENRLCKDDTLSMEFEIPGDNMPVFAQGMVMWSAEKADKKFDVGLMLTDITRPDRSRILAYAYAQWLKFKNIGRKE